MTGTISWLTGVNVHMDTLSARSLPAEPSKLSTVSTASTASVSTVLPPVDPQHQTKLQALTNQVQSGQYSVQPQKVATAWLKTVR